MTDPQNTYKANWTARAAFGLGVLVGFGAGLLMDPSCNPPELESQPLGKPSPPLPPPEL